MQLSWISKHFIHEPMSLVRLNVKVSIHLLQFNDVFDSLQFGFIFAQLVKMVLESQTLLMVKLHSNSF
jgi:hypothetical protein